MSWRRVDAMRPRPAPASPPSRGIARAGLASTVCRASKAPRGGAGRSQNPPSHLPARTAPAPAPGGWWSPARRQHQRLVALADVVSEMFLTRMPASTGQVLLSASWWHPGASPGRCALRPRIVAASWARPHQRRRLRKRSACSANCQRRLVTASGADLQRLPGGRRGHAEASTCAISSMFCGAQPAETSRSTGA